MRNYKYNGKQRLAGLLSVLAVIFVSGAAVAVDVRDLDRDGVADRIDQCPGSSSKHVDAMGCGDAAEQQQSASTADADGDGVADAADLCPDQKHNKAVDKNGCSIVAFFNASGVYFYPGASSPKKSSVEVVNSSVASLREILAAKPELVLDVVGYGDGEGQLALAEKRAKQVRADLVSQGVPAAQLTARATEYASAVNCSKNRVERCWERNRRVELWVSR